MIFAEARHLKIIKDILQKYPYHFYVYGSRARGDVIAKAFQSCYFVAPRSPTSCRHRLSRLVPKLHCFGYRKSSDLDLCFFDNIPNNIRFSIEEDFEESRLPYPVDLLDWNKCDPSFQEIIKKDLQAIMIPFPNIDPVIVSIGPISIYWYSLAYVFGIIFGWWRASALSLKFNLGISKKQLEDFITYEIVGIIMGGRLGYVLLYDPAKYLAHPIEIFKTYEGGMSFHGGFVGLIIAGLIYCRKYKIEFMRFMDLMTMVAPAGIFLGRIANFVNAELYGRVTNVPWAVVFPGSDGEPRHPSQLYEALLEGLVLFFIMHFSQKALLVKGRASGIFFIFYALFRILVECFREPDVQLGFLFGTCTMGQLLCVPMLIFGICLLFKNSKKN